MLCSRMPQTITCTENQQFIASANPLDAAGFPGVVPAGAAYAWSSDAPTIARVNTSTSSSSQVDSVSPGTANITVTLTPVAGPAVSSTFQVIVTGGPVASFNFTFTAPA